MKVPSSHSTITSITKETAAFNLDQDTDLTITMTINPQIHRQRAHRPRSYRAMQRLDGVIIEQPRYRPSSAPPTLPTKIIERTMFQPKTSVFELSSPWSRDAEGRKRIEEDLQGVRTFDDVLRRQLGRDGYNGPFAVEKSEGVMGRFRSEEGPWTAYSVTVES